MNKKTLFTLLVVVLLVALAILFRARNQDLLLQGEVDAPEVIVTSKAKGRITERLVERGDDVKAGQLMLKMDAPELIAQLNAAQATRDQAKYQYQLSMNGTREESIRNLRATLADAEASYKNANDLLLRNQRVAAKGYISAQELDDSLSSRDSALEKVKAARANLDEGIHGDRIEQREIYGAQLQQAEQDLIEIKVQADELNVIAPVDGEVGPIPSEVGELLNASSPLLTLVRQNQAYFIFNLREDILAHVRKGDKIRLRIPALNNQEIDAEVRYIAPLGDYATKRATRATGDFDLKTFEVRLWPVQPTEGLRQGMSALWQWKE
ncbi:HlyD family efflux transporter periplasmic adaptor subunit [Shimwellia pseudoproteus]|uniref:HlyD family secretion protein n=1 Tax=Shimwellia pseudoproteus TaxID=570012 RepID=UPI0018ECEF5E|nr:efflux RND transporter periplasmic adaptor subunit [Shimwellia pseudoproteus]MBJ3815796.1 HlyD family efflux transporter periplasmic adaptor subunit [Shimwellia pseudoproteus]